MEGKRTERALDGSGGHLRLLASSCLMLSHRILERKRMCVDLESSHTHGPFPGRSTDILDAPGPSLKSLSLRERGLCHTPLEPQ